MLIFYLGNSISIQNSASFLEIISKKKEEDFIIFL